MFLRPDITDNKAEEQNHSEGHRDINQILGEFAPVGLLGKEKNIGWLGEGYRRRESVWQT